MAWDVAKRWLAEALRVTPPVERVPNPSEDSQAIIEALRTQLIDLESQMEAQRRESATALEDLAGARRDVEAAWVRISQLQAAKLPEDHDIPRLQTALYVARSDLQRALALIEDMRKARWGSS